MKEFRTVVECARPEFICNLSVSRAHEQGLIDVHVQISAVSESKAITLSGYEELGEAVSQMLLAESFVVSEELGTGKEFGTIRIECWVDETYSEYYCDAVILCPSKTG